MEQSYTVTKTTVECYKLRHSSGMYWADITIDETGPNAGRIAIASDFGSWNTSWNAMGGTLKEFLPKCDIGYLCKNFASRTHFNADATIEGLKKTLIEHVRQGHTDIKGARPVFDQIVECEGYYHKAEFEHFIYNQRELMGYFETPELIMEYDPGLVRFFDMVWPEFIKAITPIDSLQLHVKRDLSECADLLFSEAHKHRIQEFANLHGQSIDSLMDLAIQFNRYAQSQSDEKKTLPDYVQHFSAWLSQYK